jgi:hypothetical protein
MNEPKHAIVSLSRFKDKDLMKIYFDVSKKMLIPSLKGQTNQNFEWVLMVLKEDISFARDYLEMDFTPVENKQEFVDYVTSKDFVIQTRHDIDDWMNPAYVDEIQKLYRQHIGQHDKFLVQSQPVRLNYPKGSEIPMKRYTAVRNSMFLSLCQRDVTATVLDRKHGQMHEVANRVFNVPDGMTKWVIHGNNRSCGGKR